MNIPVILGSVREGRLSEKPAKLMVEKLKQAGAESQLVDFKELPLPFLDSLEEPSDLNKVYPYPNVQKWSAIADAADAFIFVIPEYNHSYPGVLKNALDWLYPEFDHKPVGLVGVSNGQVGGARALTHIRPIIECFSMFAVRETIMFVRTQNVFGSQGELLDNSYEKKIAGLIKSLIFSAEAMKKAKA